MNGTERTLKAGGRLVMLLLRVRFGSTLHFSLRSNQSCFDRRRVWFSCLRNRAGWKQVVWFCGVVPDTTLDTRERITFLLCDGYCWRVRVLAVWFYRYCSPVGRPSEVLGFGGGSGVGAPFIRTDRFVPSPSSEQNWSCIDDGVNQKARAYTRRVLEADEEMVGLDYC
ncbi:hypothetical protein RP20_CCG024467 [Aedes albopictus]|nr:hypothetical protein RP20_CCG024467 [Aedes albopictus]